MLRTTKDNRTYRVPIKTNGEDTIFILHSLGVEHYMDMSQKLKNLKLDTADSFKSMLDDISQNIVKIEGYSETPREVLGILESTNDIREVITGVLGFGTLSREEMENLYYSPGQSTPVSVSHAEKSVVADSGPVSITLGQKEPLKQKA